MQPIFLVFKLFNGRQDSFRSAFLRQNGGKLSCLLRQLIKTLDSVTTVSLQDQEDEEVGPQMKTTKFVVSQFDF